MEHLNLLFKKVEPLDKEINKLKAIVACKTLRIVSIVMLCLTAVSIIIFAIGNASYLGDAFFRLMLGLVSFFIGGLLHIFTIIYAKKYIEEFEANSPLNLTGIYVFIVFSIIYTLDSLVRGTIISMVAYGFMIFLWFTVMTCIKNLNSIDYKIE